MPTIHYTSGNLANSERIIVSLVKPNVRYDVTYNQTIEHLKSDNTPSQLVYTSEVVPGSHFYIAPSDNVFADIELVRSGNNIGVNLLDFVYQNYTGYEYTFDVKAYSNLARTNQVRSVSLDNDTVPESKSMNLSSLDTTAYYFQAQDFYNTTASTNVYIDRAAKVSGTALTLKLYDIRGLAYMRDLNYSNEPNQLTTLSFSSPGSVFLSAEGTRMMVAVFTSSGLTVSKYRMKKGDWVSVGTKSLSLFPDETFRYPGETTYGVAAFSEYGDKYVVGVGGTLIIYNFETDFLEKEIQFPGSADVQCITMSADGTRLFVSGNHATGQSGNTLTGPTGGTAKIFNVETGSEIANLSSDMIESFDSTLYYGSDSALSGDGNTAVVFGSVNTSATGFVWKLNAFSGSWEVVATLDFPGNHNNRTPCSFSHDGKALVVCGNNNTARIFNTDDYLTWTSQSFSGSDFNSCDISGDGKTVIVTIDDNQFNLYTYDGSWTRIINHHIPGSGSFNSCALSYDGSTVCLQNNNTYTVQFDKNVTINTVYDYFNLKSGLYFNYNYSFDYTNDIGTPTWNIQEPLTLGLHNMDTANETAYYGYWDSTSISADGRFVLVGAPMENKVYLYDTNLNEVAHTFTETNYFGVRCAMDDLAKRVVIVAHANIYFYERSVAGFTLRGSATNHGYNSEIFQLKMSKDGSTVLLTRELNATEIQKWDLGTDWSWNTVPDSTTLSSGTKKVSAVDLSYDGQYIVAGQRTDGNGNTGDLTVFYPGGNRTTTVSFSKQTYMHSVAISSVPNASGEYTIITGDTNPYSSDLTEARFHVFKFHKTSNALDAGISDSVSGLPIARYGRIATMNYDGTLALLSGNNEQDDPAIFHKGGAVLIDTFNRDKITSFYYEPTGTEITYADNVGSSLKKKFNGFGSSCRISSDNNHILVGGGGYAFKYSAINAKTLYFPLTANGTSSDGAFTFSAGGSYSSSNGLTLGAGQSASINLNSSFQFSNTAGFIFSFEMKPTNINTESSFAIKISVDDSFFVRVANFNGNTGLVLNITDYVDKGNSFINNFDGTFKSFSVQFNYDENIILNGSQYSNLAPLGATGFKPFSIPSVLTIYSEQGASIKNLRMYAFD